jgi:hypothetical protein
MPPVYLDGIRLQANHVRLVMNIMGTLNETCGNCGGSMIEVKGILIHSSERPTIFHTWCATCGRFNRLSQNFPMGLLRVVIGRVASELSLAS